MDDSAPAPSNNNNTPGGGLFGSTPAPGTAAAPSPAPASTINTSQIQQPIANIPAYHKTFPRLQTRYAVLDHVQRVTGSGRELIHILSNEEGKVLSDPKSILKKPQEDGTLRNALIKCRDGASVSSNATGGSTSLLGGGGLFGSSGGMFGQPQNQGQQQQQPQTQQVTVTLSDKPASITQSIAKDVLRLSDELHLSVSDAVALFAEANALVTRNEAESKELEDDFVEVLIRNGKMGLDDEKSDSETNKQALQQREEDISPVIQTARRLFFHERAALLSTILDLVRYRIEATENLNGTSPIIVATDQLLQSGLVTNLVASIRELNDMTRELRRDLKNATVESSRMRIMGGANTAAPSGGNSFGGFGANATPSTAQIGPNLDMKCALLGFTQMQRQLAAECLFYLAYHTQLSAEEVCSLIDLIKDLTNGNQSTNDEGLPLLDPLVKDVPKPYEEDSIATFDWQRQQHYGAWNKSLSVKAKSEKVWKEELVSILWARGQPQLLQCISTLIMSFTCALDAQHTLMNRQNHGPNLFGKGNALLSPMTGDMVPSSLGDLQSVHSRLDPESRAAENQWKRRDIWGLLLIPYALLLRNATGPQLLSPRGSGGSRPSPTRSPPVQIGHVNMQATCTKCLMVASQLKSLTFARTSLVPSFGTSSLSKLEKHGVDSSIVDFYVTVFADFTSRFIDALCATGNLPITRREWFDDEYQLAQADWAEKEQRRQFGVWAGQTIEDDASGPREVNLMDRPDCLEDIFALVSCVCSTYPEGSKAFWKIIEQDDLDGKIDTIIRLAPSKFLERLDLIHTESDSLLFVYLSFLASLALSDGIDDTDEATNGASTIHSFLCGERTINPHSDRHVPCNWINIISAVRSYAEHLSLDGGDRNKSSTEGLRSSASNVAESSTSYYYGVSNTGSSNAESTSQGRPSTPNDPQSKDLDEVGTNTLMALLCLISNVAARSSEAREHILGIQLPVSNRDASTESYREGSLEIIFSLLTTPISTEIQGMTFMAIANLLQPTAADHSLSSEDSTKPHYSKRAWELLEMIQLLPIKLLENGSLNPETVTVSSFSSLGRNQASNPNELPLSVFPPSPDYGLIYQFEHVEADIGSYSSTEGFMYLLTTLIRTVGCPSDLGSQWRLRTGCSPYVEFVTKFVLPRATGLMKHVKPLPFATVADEYRLINRALEVVDAILVRYVVPFSTDNFLFDQFKLQYKTFLNTAEKDVGVSLIPGILRDLESLDENEMNEAVRDFKNIYVSNQDSASTTMPQTQSLDTTNANRIPLPKTPAFCIMSQLLSFNKSQLFSAIHVILCRHGGSHGVHICGEKMFSRSIATALFRETPPNIESSKSGADCSSQRKRNQIDAHSYEATLTSLQQSIIEPVHPMLLLSCTESNSKDISHGESPSDAVLWRERSILLALRIFSSVIVREEAFTQLAQHANLSIMPTLSFKGPMNGSFAHRLLEEEKVYVAKLSNILSKAATVRNQHNELLPLITDCIGYNASSLRDCQDIAKTSFCLVSYITQTFPQSQTIRYLCGDDTDGSRLANTFSRGLLLPTSERRHSLSVQHAILDLVLSNIGMDSSSQSNLSMMILGSDGTSKRTVLNAILALIADVNFVVNPVTSSSATKCFEVLYRLMQRGAKQTPAILLSPEFWYNQVIRYLGTQSSTTLSILHDVSSDFVSDRGEDSNWSNRNNNVLHSISWLMKGLALELYALSADGRGSKMVNPAQSLVALLGMLFSQPESILQTVLLNLPLGQSKSEFLQHSLNSLSPIQDALKGASIPLQGPSDVCSRFEIIDMSTLSNYFAADSKDAKEATVGWANAWNSFVSRSCACYHISHAWSDLCRTAIIVSQVMESNSMMRRPYAHTRVITETLCALLLRLNEPDYLVGLSQYGLPQINLALASGGNIEPQSALPLSIAALSLTDFLCRDLLNEETCLADEDVTRVCALLEGSISSCRHNLAASEECINILKCTLTKMHAVCGVE